MIEKLYCLRVVGSFGFSYLRFLSADGCRARFTGKQADAMHFTREEIDKFREDAPHVKGRVVLYRRAK